MVVGPDLASSDREGHPPKKWLGPILDAEPDLDVLSHHQYDGGNTVLGRVKLIEELQTFRSKTAYGDKPLWITEIGFRIPSETPTGETQARDLRRTVDAMFSRPWWEKTFWFDSHGPGWGLFDGEQMNAVPSYETYREVSARAGFVSKQVAHMAQTVFGRGPAAADERDWLQHVLGEDGSLLKLARIFCESDEFQKRRAELGYSDDAFGRELYRSILGRDDPDAEGLQTTVASLREGRTAERLVDMLESREFKDRVEA